MVKKEFLSYDTVRNNAIRLACRIFKEFGTPDIIYVSLRGGAAMGNVISEYFKILAHDKKVLYAAVVARAYRDVFDAGEVTVDGWTYPPQKLGKNDKILLVDDIFDTGKTINHLVSLIMEQGIKRSNIGVIVHDYKIRLYEPLHQPVHPDFFCRKHLLKTKDEDFWIHYSSHELKCLTEEEIAEHYIARDPALKEAFECLFKNRGTSKS